MTIWQLLKDYVHEFEIANQCEFSDGAWQRVKRLERDIYEAMREEPKGEIVPALAVEGFDFHHYPSDELIETLRSKHYQVKHSEYGYQPVSPDGFAIIRGWTKTEQDAWRHCASHYDQEQAQS
jgi:hypothetical protein